MKRLLLTLLALLAATLTAARAQIKVELELKRHYYVRYEALLATVKITNLSGRDLLLEDAESAWFGFTVTQGGPENLISPRNTDYHLEPLEIKIGETLRRQVDLNTLFPLTELAPYKVRATIFSKELKKYFGSNSATFEITEGHVIKQQEVGVPETMANAGATHRFTLLSSPGLDHEYLYCRIEDMDTGKVFGTYRLGHLIDGTEPQMEFDATNTLNVLQIQGPKVYLLTQIGVNGECVGQAGYNAPKYKPMLKRDKAGGVVVIGATPIAPPPTLAAGSTPAPKLSDRPPGLK
jgi:hypothetical protein